MYIPEQYFLDLRRSYSEHVHSYPEKLDRRKTSFNFSGVENDGRVEINVNDEGYHIVYPRNGPTASAIASGKVVLVELKPLLSEEKLLLSFAAGIKMKDLQDWFGQRRIIRVMLNNRRTSIRQRPSLLPPMSSATLRTHLASIC